MEFRLHPSAPPLIALWLALPGLLICPFVLWQSLAAGLCFGLAWLGCAVVLGLSMGHTLRGSARAGELYVTCGVLFKLTWRIPLRFITGLTRQETPLLQLLHSCILVVHSSGRVLLLPVLSEGQALQLVAILQQEELESGAASL